MGSERAPDRRVGDLVVLDDDPTGAQLLSGVRVLLAWSPSRVREALRAHRAVHLLTNSRALPPDEAREVVRWAAAAARRGAPSARVVLRGDSTLRAHLREEYEGVRDVLYPGNTPPLLLVPALPSAGRVTRDGQHLLLRNGDAVPLSETEYARDGVFAYSTSRLLDYAEERSQGLFAARDGLVFPLDALRAEDGARGLGAKLGALSATRRAAVCAPDAETLDDIEVIAEAYRRATDDGAEVTVRCAPAFVGVLAGTLAGAPAEPPAAPRHVLVVCGSYVETTSRQLAALGRAAPDLKTVEVDPVALAGGGAEAEIDRAARLAGEGLSRDGVALLTTPRERARALETLAVGARVASGLARAAGAVHPAPDVVVAKGGITSATTLGEGLSADAAEVIGPLLPGVSLWQLDDGRSFVVIPGNVGEDDLLVRLLGILGVLRSEAATS
jgi:uncharacterized protein YgbK (DUF1537 family)